MVVRIFHVGRTKDDFVRIGEFIGSAVDIAVEVQKDLGKVQMTLHRNRPQRHFKSHFLLNDLHELRWCFLFLISELLDLR